MSQGEMNKHNETGRIEGRIITRSLNEKFFLEPNADKGSAKAPDFLIFGKAPAGHVYKAGLAYRRDIKRGDMAGRECFYLVFNDPDFGENPIAVSAYPNNAMGWDLTVERKTREAAPAQEAA